MRKGMRGNGLPWDIGWDATRVREDATFRAVAPHIAVGSGNLQSLVHHELGDAQGSGGRSPTRINT